MAVRSQWLVVMAALGLAGAANAEILVLITGDRVEGEIVSQTDSEILLRRSFSGNENIRYVQRYNKSAVLRIEQSPVSTAPAEPPPGVASPPTSRPMVLPPQPIEDKKKFLEGIIGKWRAGKTAVAGLEATRLIGLSSPDELAEFSDNVRSELKLSLAELAAEAHWKAATEKGKNHAVHLNYVTNYELPALVPLLIKEYEAALKMEVKTQPPEARRDTKAGAPAVDQTSETRTTDVAASTPAEGKPVDGNALTIANWIDRPTQFDAPRPEAVAFQRHVQYTLSLLAERIRLDPKVKRDKDLRASLNTKRMQFGQLLKAVTVKAIGSTRSGGTRARPAASEAESNTNPPEGAGSRQKPTQDFDPHMRDQIKDLQDQHNAQQPPGQ